MKLRIHRYNIPTLLIALYCVCILSPVIKRTIGDYAILLIGFVFLLVMFNKVLRARLHEKNTIICIFLYICILLMYKVMRKSTASTALHLDIVEYFMAYVLFVAYYRTITVTDARFILFSAYTASLITLLQNYRLKMQLGYRYSIHLYETAGIKAIMSTQYGSAILLLIGAFICAFYCSRSKSRKLFYLAGTIICFMFNLIVMQRGITFLLSMLMIMLMILYSSEHRSAKRFLFAVLFVFLAIFGAIFYEPILMIIGRLTGSTRITSRLEQLIRLLASRDVDEAGGSLTGRLNLIAVSIKTFWASFSNFFLGTGYRTDTNELAGNHSQFFDEFARFGVFGGLIGVTAAFNMLKSVPEFSALKNNAVLKNQLSVLLLIFILRGFLGDVYSSSIGVIMFIVIPTMLFLAQREGDTKL